MWLIAWGHSFYCLWFWEFYDPQRLKQSHPVFLKTHLTKYPYPRELCTSPFVFWVSSSLFYTGNVLKTSTGQKEINSVLVVYVNFLISPKNCCCFQQWRKPDVIPSSLHRFLYLKSLGWRVRIGSVMLRDVGKNRTQRQCPGGHQSSCPLSAVFVSCLIMSYQLSFFVSL